MVLFGQQARSFSLVLKQMQITEPTVILAPVEAADTRAGQGMKITEPVIILDKRKRPHSPERRAAISVGLMGNQNARGCVRSAETRAKMIQRELAQ